MKFFIAALALLFSSAGAMAQYQPPPVILFPLPNPPIQFGVGDIQLLTNAINQLANGSVLGPFVSGNIVVGGPGSHQIQDGGKALSSVVSTTAQDQTLSGGANQVSFSLGTFSSGTSTIDCGKSPLQYFTDNGAFTLAAPSNDGSCIVLDTNGASAGTITFSGFSVGSNTGDSLDTTNGHKFSISIWRINGTSGYTVSAHQ